MAAIEVDHVTKEFAGGVRAVDDVTLTVADGEFMVLVGPSGCGKSTLLRMIAGLEEVTDGTVSIGGVDVTDLEPPDRDIAMVFQNYALYPHMNVRQNLGFGLSVRRTPKREIASRVQEVATLLGLQDLLDRKPANLSGGQRQRVAMGRAIIREPKAFLMDEPLSNLDAKLRVGMRASLAQLHRAARRYQRLRDARSDRGDDARSTSRGDARRADRPGRRAATALPGPEGSLRGNVHRLAVDEPGGGDPGRRPCLVRTVSCASRSRSATRARRRSGRARHPPRSVQRCGAWTAGLTAHRGRGRCARGARLGCLRLLSRGGPARDDRVACSPRRRGKPARGGRRFLHCSGGSDDVGAGRSSPAARGRSVHVSLLRSPDGRTLLRPPPDNRVGSCGSLTCRCRLSARARRTAAHKGRARPPAGSTAARRRG